MLIATNAIILKRIPYSDTSVICRAFTEDWGKVTILAKGVLRPKNITGALLEPVNHVHIQYYNKSNRDIQTLKDANFIQQYPIIRNNLSRIILGLAIVEIIDKATLDYSPYPVLYRLGWRVLDKLNDKTQNIWLVFAFFLYQLSIRLGFMPNLKSCSKCNSVISHGGIDDYTGELVCEKCVTQSQIHLEENSFAVLQKITSLHLDDLQTLTIKNNSIFNPIRFLDIFTSFHIEGLKRVKSMEMVRKLINEENVKNN